MKILVISHSGGCYGAERSLLTVVKGLSSLGYDITVTVPKDGWLKEHLERNNIRVVIWKYYGWLGKKNRLIKGAFRALYNFLSSLFFCMKIKNNFDFVYTNTITTPFGVFLSKMLSLPHIWHVREFVHEDMGADFDLPHKVTKYIFLLNSYVAIYNSLSVMDKFQEYFGEHSSKLIYNALEKPKAPSNYIYKEIGRESSVNLCMVSSLHPGKGHIDAILAFEEIVKTYPSCHLSIVGTGLTVYILELEKLVIEKGLEDNISFVGFMENSIEIMTTSDIFLMCSRNEAFGRVTLEAMSVGCPVIGADSGGTKEILDDGRYGILYKQGDSKDLACKIIKLISDNQLREEMSILGKKRASDFSVDNLISNLEQVLKGQ